LSYDIEAICSDGGDPFEIDNYSLKGDGQVECLGCGSVLFEVLGRGIGSPGNVDFTFSGFGGDYTKTIRVTPGGEIGEVDL